MIQTLKIWIFCCLFSFSIVPGFCDRLTDETSLVTSEYTSLIQGWIQHWPPHFLHWSHALSEVRIQCFENPKKSDEIGLQQQMILHAPLERVQAVLNAMELYQRLFPGYEKIQVLARSETQVLTSWEQKIPLFFIPNIHYELMYWIDQKASFRKIYRYQLAKKNEHIFFSDGLIVLEPDPDHPDSQTRYTEFDFFQAHWGILKVFASFSIWKESVEGILLSDIAIKFRSEHPDWSYEKIAQEGALWLKQFPLEEALKQKVTLSEWIKSSRKDSMKDVHKNF